MTEMWAVRDGLWAGPNRSAPLGVLREILVLASEFSSLWIVFCYREANGVANSLAKHAATTQGRFVLHSSAPGFLLKTLCKDQLGI
ncbi:hypothetical protein RHGRI_028903 [Rhododendron griersonianum]|uniref:RNase H type-1 domain-containing protein n=1 Tax=Rhododendron griersonianum TaxID=479676 RepID=A0AAV6IKX3_9ERIC|nr:hypothetical protein RHGRI_028903 [Rhododendron griersonianum]